MNKPIVRFENRKGLAFAIGPVARMSSPKGLYSYFAPVDLSDPLINPVMFPLPS